MKDFKKVVYLLKNNANGKIYVGNTGNFKERSYAHLNNLMQQRHPNKFLQEDYNLYGKDVFEFFIAEEVVSCWGFKKEQEWMIRLKTYDPKYGYNNEDPFFYSKQYGKYTKNYFALLEKCQQE